MIEVFLSICNHAYAASILIFLLLLLRPFLRRVQWYYPFFWGIVAVRLMLPFSIPSPFCLVPSTNLITPDTVQYAQQSTIDTGIASINGAVNPFLDTVSAGNPMASVNPMYIWTITAAWVWISGFAIMIMYLFFSTLRVRRCVREAVLFRENVYLCDHIATPFLYGIIHPHIYLPSAMRTGTDAQIEAVLCHERTHQRRLDHITKLVGVLLLSVYWFVPTVWIAYFCFCRDLEYACDASVIAGLDTDGRKMYSETLLSFAVQEKYSACPIAFGENAIKGRIRAILSYKKPPFWCILLLTTATVILAACFLSSPAQHTEDGTTIDPETIESLMWKQNDADFTDAWIYPLYEDADDLYPYPAILSDRITIVLPDGMSIGIIDALHMEYIPLDDLTCAGIPCYRTEEAPVQRRID